MGGSIVRMANGWTTAKPTFGQPNQPVEPADLTRLVINEWLADPGEGGRDWLELYNPDANAPALITGLHIRVGRRLAACTPSRPFRRAAIAIWLDTRPARATSTCRCLRQRDAHVDHAGGGGVRDMKYAKQRTGVSEGRRPDGSSRTVKFTRGATPGAPNIVPSYSGPRFNEVLASNRGGFPTGSNCTTTPARPSAGRCQPVAACRRPGDWMFPADTTIPNGEYLVVGLTAAVRPAMRTPAIRSRPRAAAFTVRSGRLSRALDRVRISGPDQPIGMSGGRWKLLAPRPPEGERRSVALGSPLRSSSTSGWRNRSPARTGSSCSTPRPTRSTSAA
ncbi:MAG: hypothetical protein CM1200mP34_2010 [Verrucomicrobiales bacterium]|nr:MAG: hypothetical protein CM1200mP34_2010 [Verrucomicrobiales bacterium]